MGFFKNIGNSFKKSTRFIKHTVADVTHVVAPVVAQVGTKGYDLSKKVINTGVKVGGKVLSKVEKIVDTGIGTIGNIGKLSSPGNIMLYMGLAIVGIVMLPKILDTKAASAVAERV